jgi:hypothetical protein
MVFTGFRVVAEVFRAEIRFQHVVWMHSAEVDALFRLNSVVCIAASAFCIL